MKKEIKQALMAIGFGAAAGLAVTKAPEVLDAFQNPQPRGIDVATFDRPQRTWKTGETLLEEKAAQSQKVVIYTNRP